jgi:hypothetical protein
MNAAAVLTNTVYLDAQNNPQAVFVIKIVGALSTGTFAKVVLLNGAQPQNVYWRVGGATAINNYAEFKGMIVTHGAELDLGLGSILEGRAMTTSGIINTESVMVNMHGCSSLSTTAFEANTGDTISIYPNPFKDSLNIIISESSKIDNAEMTIFDAFGRRITTVPVSKQLNTFHAGQFPAGMYFYNVTSNGKSVQSGKLIAK